MCFSPIFNVYGLFFLCRLIWQSSGYANVAGVATHHRPLADAVRPLAQAE
jgi:hypothetical protein